MKDEVDDAKIEERSKNADTAMGCLLDAIVGCGVPVFGLMTIVIVPLFWTFYGQA